VRKAIQSASPERNTIIAGILVMLLGIFLFAANDALGKYFVETFSVGQVLLLRSIGAFLVLVPMLWRQGKSDLFRPAHPGIQIARVLATAGDTGLFYAAVAYLPLANVITFYMASPIYVAAISHFFLNEKIRWRRWLAICVGFCGVLIALKPDAGMFASPASLYAIIGSLCFALVIIFNRVLRSTSDVTLVTWQTIGALIIGGLLTINHWQAATTLQWGGFFLLGAVSCIGHILIAHAMKLAPASVLAPLPYTLLLWGIVFGIIFFGNYPAPHVLVGAAIIILAGLFIYHRKKVVNKKLSETDVGKVGR